MKQKLCVIGEALIDFIPQRKGCALKDVEGFTRVAGGAPANVAGAAARLGIPAMVLTQLGADAFGDYIIQSLKDSGIDTSHILQTKEHDTSLSFRFLAGRRQPRLQVLPPHGRRPAIQPGQHQRGHPGRVRNGAFLQRIAHGFPDERGSSQTAWIWPQEKVS